MKSIAFEGLTCFTQKLTIGRSPLSDQIKGLILESDPNPGYYAKGDFPPNKHLNDWHLFLPIKNQVNCFQDLILRHACQLSEKYNETLRVFPGQLTVHNTDYPCIRINTQEIEHLPSIVAEIKQMGLRLLHDKKTPAYQSRVFFKKFTEFVQLEEDVYQDSDNPNRYFFPIEGYLDFDRFLEGMSRIKFSCDFHLFDSFLASLFKKNKVKDFVGIYSEHCDTNRFPELKQHLKNTFE